MTSFPLDRAFLVGVWVETLLYGVYVPLFISCVYVLIRKRQQASIDISMLAASFALFAFATLHVLCALVRLIEAFIDNEDQRFGTLIYLSKLGLPINIMMEALAVINSAIGDCVILYRCYVVWGKDLRIVIVPLILLICIAATALYGVAEFANISTNTVFAMKISRVVTAVFSSTLAWQVLVSSLIIGRLLWMARRSAKLWGSKHARLYISVIRLVIESALIYVVTLAVFLTLYLLHHNAEKIVFNSMVQVAAICPTLIIVRVGLRLYEREEGLTSTLQTGLSAKPVMFKYPQPQPSPRPSGSVHMSQMSEEYDFIDTDDFVQTVGSTREGMGVAV